MLSGKLWTRFDHSLPDCGFVYQCGSSFPKHFSWYSKKLSSTFFFLVSSLQISPVFLVLELLFQVWSSSNFFFLYWWPLLMVDYSEVRLAFPYVLFLFFSTRGFP